MANQVVISGIGHVSRAGRDYNELAGVLSFDTNTHNAADKFSELLYSNSDFSTFRATEAELSQFGIPRRELRFLGPIMNFAVAASHDALLNASILGCNSLLADLELIIACGPGVRDQDADLDIARELSKNTNLKIGALLSRRLRPTEFLCQLPNLTAANICSFFGVTGANRTLMGGETAGMHALHMAYRKIASGQSERVLVGGAGFGQCFYSNLALAQAGLLARSVSEESTTVLGSASSFFVLESRAAADARNATWSEVIEGLSIASDDAFLLEIDNANPIAHARISNYTDKSALTRKNSNELDVTALIGNTREDSIFSGMALGITLMRNKDLNRGVVSMQHLAGTQSYVALSAGNLR